jgi:sarcosine oxidase
MLDAIVVGLGGAGSATTYHLARSGSSVLGLEQFGPVHAHGSSHGRTRIYRTAYFEGPGYVPLVQRAQELWRQLSVESGERVIQPTGGLVIGHADSGYLAGAIRTATIAGLAFERLDAAQVQARFPAIRLRSYEQALLDPAAGVVFPEVAVRCHASGAAEQGAELRYGTRVSAWSSDGGTVTVRTPSGEHRARTLVLTAGPWTTAMVPDVALPLTLERQFQLWFPGAGSDLVTPDRMPVFVWDRGPEIQTYGVPDFGDGVKVGAWTGRNAATPETADRIFREEEAEPVRRFVAESIHGVAPHEREAVSCLYTNAPDHDFLIGRHPRHSNVLIVSACSGHGFKFTSVVGEIVARLARGEPPGFDLAPFDPGRFARATPRQGGPPRVSNTERS